MVRLILERMLALNYKYLLFDLDNTLLDFHTSEHQALMATFNDYQIEASPTNEQAYLTANQAMWALFEQGKIDLESLQDRRFSDFFKAIDRPDLDPRKARWVYADHLAQAVYYMDGALELLNQLQKDYPLYITSNGITYIQTKRLTAAGLTQYFQDIFLSQEVGSFKPDRAYFDYVFDQIQAQDKEFSLDQTLIIGDSLSSDMQGGRNAGITTVWYHPQGIVDQNPRQVDHQIQHLNQLPSLLQQLNQ